MESPPDIFHTPKAENLLLTPIDKLLESILKEPPHS